MSVLQFFRHIPIPPLFHSLYDGPFQKCLICETGLLDDRTLYRVERAFAGTEPIFEYAMCFGCCQSLSGELSAESLMRLKVHFEERVDLPERTQTLLSAAGTDVEPWLDRCLLTKTDRAAARVHTICADFAGDALIFTGAPFMVSDAGFEQMTRLLSKQTRDKLGELTEQFFGMPPEYSDLPDRPPYVMF